MARERIGLLVGHPELDKRHGGVETATGGTHEVRTTVYALVPEVELVYVRDDDGLQYALTPATSGVELKSLHKGQSVMCTVTRRLPRVLSAHALG